MSPAIYLIVEGETDAKYIVPAILKARGIRVHVEIQKPTGNKAGISRLAEQLPELIRTALAKQKPGDCIAVLHDADEQVQPDRRDYERIKAICNEYEGDIAHVIARDAIEAWLLADSGMCRWLEKKAENWDERPKPKDTLNSWLQEKKIRMQGSYRAKVLEHLDGTGDKHSPSMKRALKHLENAPCMDSSTVTRGRR